MQQSWGKTLSMSNDFNIRFLVNLLCRVPFLPNGSQSQSFAFANLFIVLLCKRHGLALHIKQIHCSVNNNAMCLCLHMRTSLHITT